MVGMASRFCRNKHFSLCCKKEGHVPGRGLEWTLAWGSEGLLAFTDFSQMNVSLPGGERAGEEFLVHGTIHNPKH